MALPAKLGTCTIVGRFVRAVLDSSDAGRDPDGIPVEGLVITIKTTLAKPVAYFRDGADSTIVVIDEMVCTTDGEGNLIGPDQQAGLLVVASNDPLLHPSGWTYKVEVRGPTIPPLEYTFVAPTGGTVNLGSVVTTPPSSGNDTYVIEGGTP